MPGFHEDNRAAAWIVAVVIAGAVVRLVIAATTGFQADDALITYRYADNLAAGKGFVYNPGEHVCGTTTPLLTILLALARLAGVAPGPASLAIAIASSMAASVLAFRLVPPNAGPMLRIAAAVGPSLLPSSLLWSVSGMETALFAAMLLWTADAFVRNRPVELGVALAGAFLTRFDGVVAAPGLVFASLLAVCQATDRRGALGAEAALLLRAAGVTVALTLPWLVFAWMYFGQLVPQSIWAKLVLYGSAGFDRSAPLPVLVSALSVAALSGPGPLLPVSPVGVVLALLGLMALLAQLRQRDRQAAVGALLLTYVVFYTASRTHVHPWYLAPPRVLLWLALVSLVAAGAVRLRLRQPVLAGIALGLACVLAVGLAWRQAKAYAGLYEHVHATLGRRLAAESRPGETVYAWDIGYVGYLSGRRILDFVGIVSPEVVPFNRERDFAGAIERFQPEWLVVGLYFDAHEMILDAPFVEARYRLVARVGDPAFASWALDDPRRRTRFVPDYVVLRRIDPSPAR